MGWLLFSFLQYWAGILLEAQSGRFKRHLTIFQAGSVTLILCSVCFSEYLLLLWWWLLYNHGSRIRHTFRRKKASNLLKQPNSSAELRRKWTRFGSIQDHITGGRSFRNTRMKNEQSHREVHLCSFPRYMIQQPFKHLIYITFYNYIANLTCAIPAQARHMMPHAHKCIWLTRARKRRGNED
jgi:hypothetical protein